MLEKNKKVVALLLVLCLVCTGLAGTGVQAKKKEQLKTKKMNLTVGETKKIVIKNKSKKTKYSYRSQSKKVATVSKSGVVKAVKAGKAKITVQKKVKNKKQKVGVVTVIVKDKNKGDTQTPTPTSTAAPTASTAALTTPSTVPTALPTVVPTASPTVAPTSSPTIQPTKKPAPTQEPFEEDPEMAELPAGYANVNESVAGTVEDITYDSTVIKEGAIVKRKAKVVLPKDYSADKEYPVIYMLHGIFGDETSMYGDKVQYVIWNAIANGDVREVIVVFPNVCANEAGKGEGFNVEHYAAYNNFLNDLKECLMPYMNENYSTLTGRENTAICGFSMGGRTSLYIGFTLQELFGYVGAFCPAPGIFEHWDNGVHELGLFQQDTFTLKDEYMNNTLVLIAAGAKDGVVKDFPKTYTEALTKNGVPHFYYETMGGEKDKPSGGGHDGSVYKHGLYNFLKRIFKTDEK